MTSGLIFGILLLAKITMLSSFRSTHLLQFLLSLFLGVLFVCLFWRLPVECLLLTLMAILQWSKFLWHAKLSWYSILCLECNLINEWSPGKKDCFHCCFLKPHAYVGKRLSRVIFSPDFLIVSDGKLWTGQQLFKGLSKVIF